MSYWEKHPGWAIYNKKNTVNVQNFKSLLSFIRVVVNKVLTLKCSQYNDFADGLAKNLEDVHVLWSSNAAPQHIP